MSDTQRKSCLITGAAGGIGRVLVQEFADAGYLVIATDRQPQSAALPCHHYIQADLEAFVEDQQYAAMVVGGIKQHLQSNKLNVLINNAAIQILGGADMLDRDDWHKTLSINLLAPFLLCQALLPELENGNGCILNMSSVHAKLTKKNFVAYATSKAALSGLTRALAVDLGSRVRVNAIEPAAVDTPMLRAGFSDNSAALESLNAYHPSGSICDPRTLARMARMLVSEHSTFLTGMVLNLDGGISSRLYDPD